MSGYQEKEAFIDDRRLAPGSSMVVCVVECREMKETKKNKELFFVIVKRVVIQSEAVMLQKRRAKWGNMLR